MGLACGGTELEWKLAVRIRRFDNATSFLEAASHWLGQSEAEHNLLLGLARQLTRGDHPYQQPIYLATVEDGQDIVGCAFRTPPQKLGLTRLPREAVPLLIDDVAGMYSDLPGILGPEGEATALARQWTRRFGGAWSIGMRQRIHVLEELAGLEIVVDGSLRQGQDSDLELAVDWTGGFNQETGIAGNAKDIAARLIRNRSLYLWEHDAPRVMVAAVGETDRGIRVGYVYSPPTFRGRGYATAAVARLSELLLSRGRKFCCLYTDLANPTSNAIYKRIGYRAVCDVVEVRIH